MAASLPHDTDFLTQARVRYKAGNEADNKQAQRERDDIAFEDGDQWPVDIKLAREGQQPTNGMPAVPARPTLVINKVREPVRQILNQERQADISVEVVPADDFGDLGITPDDTEITLREGLIRRIQRESQAQDARSWAFKRAVIAGRGYYLVMTRFLPGKTWDQEIYLHRIYNQSGVILDPAHEQPEGSDADWGFIGTWVQWDRFKAEYPKDAEGKNNPFAASTESDFIAMTESYPDWYRADGEQRAVRIVDYWYTERTSRTLAVLADGSAAWEEEIPEGAEIVNRRTVVEKQIKFCKIAGGCMIVEQTDWAGQDMPIIKVVGEEILPYDEQRRAEGLVRQARDAAMGENYMISKLVETIGLTPISPLQVDPDAIDGYETWYGVANTRALPFLPARTYDDQGRQLAAPHRPAVDPNILPMAQSIQMFDGFIQNTTGGAAPDRLGVGQRVQAAQAIKRLQDEEQFNTSNFLDNLTRSMRYEGQVINGLLYPIYGMKPGRLVRILTGDGHADVLQVQTPPQASMMTGAPQMPPQGVPGAPMPPQPGQPPGGAAPVSPPLSLQQQAKKVAKLTKDAHFNIQIKVAKAADRRRDQFVDMFGQILASDPQQMAVGGDLFYKNLDIPEAKELSKRQRQMLAPPVQQYLAAQEQGQPFDPVAQAQIGQLQTRLQQLEQIAQGLHQEADKVQAEQQTRLQIEQSRAQVELQRAQIDADKELKLQQMKDAASIAVAKVNALAKGVIVDQEATDEAMALGFSHAFDASQADADRQHERDMAQAQQVHDAAMADQQAQAAQAQQAQAAAQQQPQESQA